MMLKKTLQNIFWKEDALRRIHGSSPLILFCIPIYFIVHMDYDVFSEMQLLY